MDERATMPEGVREIENLKSEIENPKGFLPNQGRDATSRPADEVS
jgi:hypothetical protein